MRLKTTPATSSRASNVANPCMTAATLRAMPEASTTRTTGSPSHFAISAVLPASSSPSRPSNSPIMPSTTPTAPSCRPRANVAQLYVRDNIQPSRFLD